MAGWPATYVSPIETSNGQEDVQTFALEAAERLRLALDAAEQVLACELLALHQARLLAPDRMAAARGDLPGAARPGGRRCCRPVSRTGRGARTSSGSASCSGRAGRWTRSTP